MAEMVGTVASGGESQKTSGIGSRVILIWPEALRAEWTIGMEKVVGRGGDIGKWERVGADIAMRS
jgi:hypothetical protein